MVGAVESSHTKALAPSPKHVQDAPSNQVSRWTRLANLNLKVEDKPGDTFVRRNQTATGHLKDGAVEKKPASHTEGTGLSWLMSKVSVLDPRPWIPESIKAQMKLENVPRVLATVALIPGFGALAAKGFLAMPDNWIATHLQTLVNKGSKEVATITGKAQIDAAKIREGVFAGVTLLTPLVHSMARVFESWFIKDPHRDLARAQAEWGRMQIDAMRRAHTGL